ncbi:MAG: carboxypeptidase-like regulatory domain-containing protein [Phycisphaerae bacterium]|nr:carboxypeptidase-like regulatory domain-containing protein [Gemmatimonadaceae bacterium]
MHIQARLRHSVLPLAFLLSASLFAGPVLAQPASVSGTVLSDPAEKPLSGADVLIESVNKSGRSDSAGNFVLSGLVPGRYRILVRLLGFDAFRTEVTLRANEKFEADFLLKPSVTTLKNVDVKATKTTGP